MNKICAFLICTACSTAAYSQISDYFLPLIIENDTVGYKDIRGGDFVVIKVWEDAIDDIFDKVVSDNKRLKVQRASSAEKIQVEFLWKRDLKSSSEPIKEGTARHLINAGKSMRAGLLVSILGTGGGTALIYSGQPALGAVIITASGLVSTLIQFYTATEFINAGLELKE